MAKDKGTSVPEGAADVAADAARTARAAGAKGPAHRGGLSKTQLALRDTAIVAELHAGIEVKAIAKEWEITPRSVRRVWDSFKVRRTALDDRPLEIVERLLRTYEQQMVDFARMMVANADRNPSVAIAAMKGHADALERYVMLLGDIGKLPENLELFRAQSEMQRVGELMWEKIGQIAAGEATPADAQAYFADLLRPAAGFDVEGTARELGEGDA